MKLRHVRISRSAVNTIAFSSIFNIGDTNHFSPKFKAIAVQREGDAWNSNYDWKFSDYPIFHRKANWLDSELPIQIKHYHHNNQICVKNVSLTGVSQSSTLQFGGLRNIEADARIKHFRLLKERNNYPD